MGRDLPTPDFNASQAFGCVKGSGEHAAATGAASATGAEAPLAASWVSGFRPCSSKQPTQLPPQQRPGNAHLQGNRALCASLSIPAAWQTAMNFL